jgi:hypothetical protein
LLFHIAVPSEGPCKIAFIAIAHVPISLFSLALARPLGS